VLGCLSSLWGARLFLINVGWLSIIVVGHGLWVPLLEHVYDLKLMKTVNLLKHLPRAQTMPIVIWTCFASGCDSDS
jgi:hypothetical protein